MMEWISAEDRLPEKGKEVLVYWLNRSQGKEHYDITKYWETIGIVLTKRADRGLKL